jgi:hypothetical protein
MTKYINQGKIQSPGAPVPPDAGRNKGAKPTESCCSELVEKKRRK